MRTTVPTVHAPEPARVRAPRFTGLIWVAWRQQRAGLAVLALLAALLTAWLVVSGLDLRAALAMIARAHCPPENGTSPACVLLYDGGPPAQNWLKWLAVLPAVTAVFIAAPLVARGYESGSLRFAATQGVRRARWAVPQLLVPAAAGVVCCVVPALAGAWVISLYHGSALAPPWPWDPFSFDVTPLLLPCWLLLGLAVGTLAGVVFRRTVPAMAATLAASAGVAFLVFRQELLPNVLLPVGTRTVRAAAASLQSYCTGVQGDGSEARILGSCYFADPATQPRGNGVIVHGYFTHAGHALTVAQSAAVGTRVPKALFLASSPAGIRRWLAAHDYTYWVSYQPVSHYGLIQGLAAALLLVLAVALAGTAIWLLRRRPA